jgi:anaerobic selenocysteine-containing dehydrogenase
VETAERAYAAVVHASTCPLDCPDRCSLHVTVQDGRVTAIEGSQENPETQGFICAKVRRFHERVYGEDRLLHPMRRSGPKGSGRFARIGWDEAIATIAERLRDVTDRWGAEAILPYAYGGSNGLVGDGTMDARFFARLGASRLLRAVCAAPTGTVVEAMTGDLPGVAFSDYVDARLILVWGANPWHSNVHLVPYLKEARRRGARVVLLDPRRTGRSAYVDEWLPVRPGTDVVVALAMIRHLAHTGRVAEDFVRRHCSDPEDALAAAEPWTLARAAAVAGVPEDALFRLAEAYAATSPALVRIGWGLERNRNGGSAVAAILALVALAGKFGVRGGGYTLSNSSAFRIDKEQLRGVSEAGARVINMVRLGPALLGEVQSPPIQALFVYDCNPVATVPNQRAIEEGLRRDDLFTVVFDSMLTDTARFADVLLPAVTFLEQSEVYGSYGTYGLHRTAPVIPPRGEARPNETVFRDLARAMGFRGAEFEEDGDALRARSLAAVKGPLAGDRDGRFVPFDFPGTTPVQFETVWPATADQRLRLAPPELGRNLFAYRQEVADRGHPLALITPASDKTINSVLGELVKEEARLQIHPEDAAVRGIAQGQAVRIFNALGEVHCLAQLDPSIGRGVVSLPKGLWKRSFRNGASSTALCPDTLSEIGDGACFNDARVEVRALPGGRHGGEGGRADGD